MFRNIFVQQPKMLVPRRLVVIRHSVLYPLSGEKRSLDAFIVVLSQVHVYAGATDGVVGVLQGL